MCIHLEFNYKKAAQALNFFAEKEGGSINKMKALKLVYFADRYHLRKYGRPITNDEYFAMAYGPVASGVKDIAEMSDFLGPKEKDYSSEFIEVFNRYEIKSKKTYDADVFSDSDIEALSFAWNKFGDILEFDLADITHQYPEWKKHENKLKKSSRVRMNYEDFFDDPQNHFEKCHTLDPRDKADRLDQLEELSRIEALWG